MPASVARGDAVWQQLVEIVESSNRILKNAAALEDPVLFGNALLANAPILLAMLRQRRILSGAADVSATVLATLTQNIDKAIEMLTYAGALDRELRSRMLRADLHEFVGETSQARAIAAAVLPIAQVMDYCAIVADAQRHLSGTSTWSTVDARIAASTNDNQDMQIADQTDEQLLRFSRQLLSMLELPSERINIVVQHARCMRDLSRERVTWCRFLYLTDEDPQFRTEVPRYGAAKNTCFIRQTGTPIGRLWSLLLRSNIAQVVPTALL
jgi:hypothetical protein